MSVVIDGKDILVYNSFMAISMSENLDKLLNGKGKEIPAGVLMAAKNLFSVGIDYVREKRGLPLIHPTEKSEIIMTHLLLTDMLKRVKKDVNDVDSELEKLAIALEVLTPDGRQISIAKEPYQTLKNLFNAMYKESHLYPTHYDGSHSPYSVGTFDDTDE